MKLWLTITVCLTIFALNLLPSIAVGAETKWWCVLPNTNKIVPCLMEDGIVKPTKKEILYHNFFPEPDVQDKMRAIAKCESGETHEVNGKIVRGPDGFDLGFFQLRSLVWEKEAKKLGINIRTLEGNFAMARIIYDRLGFRPWVCNKMI